MRQPLIENKVCLPLDPSVLYAPFYEGQLLAIDQTLTVRPFCVPQDLPAIHSWILAYSGAANSSLPSPVPQLLETYNHLITSDYSQSLIALVDNRPLLQFDIIRADKDELSLEYAVEPGDFSFHFLFSPFFTEEPDFYTEVMDRCIKSLGYFPEVGRLFCKSYQMDRRSNLLLQQAGFVLNKQSRERTGEVNIYRHDMLEKVEQ